MITGTIRSCSKKKHQHSPSDRLERTANYKPRLQTDPPNLNLSPYSKDPVRNSLKKVINVGTNGLNPMKPTHSRNHSEHVPTQRQDINFNSLKERKNKTKAQIGYKCPEDKYRSNDDRYRSMEYRPQSGNQHQNHVPHTKNSFTPKSHQYPRKNDIKNYFSKNQDTKIFTQTGRYDIRQLIDRKKHSKPKIGPTSLTPKSKNQTISRPRGQQQMRIRVQVQSKSRGIDEKLHHRNRQAEDQATLKFQREDQFDAAAYLTAQQYDKFGNRFPQKFKKLALLGRGGFSVVWLGYHRTSKKKIAIKQILTKNPHQTHLKQIWFGSYFFEKGGQPREQFQSHIGVSNICRLLTYDIQTVDSWLYYELCQQSLGSCLFDLKSQMVNGEKNYRIKYKQFLMKMRNNVNEFKNLIIEVSKALLLINGHNIVHSDLKTQNILIKPRKSDSEEGLYIRSLKLIDFGSSFLFSNLKQFSMATPQYMPPQILNYILFQNKLQYDSQMLTKMEKYTNSWVIDIWSLGCIALQIISGVPLWMSLPTRIQNPSQKSFSSPKHVTGLFAVKGRLFNKIIAKQVQVVSKLDYHLQESNHSGVMLDSQLIHILKRMLSLNPEQRISPFQILRSLGVTCQVQKLPFY